MNRILLLTFTFIFGCSSWLNREIELKRFPIDSLDGIMTQSGVQIDKQISSDGHGSLRINATESTTVVRLFEVKGVDVDDARLIYRAQIRTENLNGQVYMEIRCQFPNKEELFSRKRITPPAKGIMDWTKKESFFFLGKERKPDNVKLNLIINGTGTVWIDDVRLLKGPFRLRK